MCVLLSVILVRNILIKILIRTLQRVTQLGSYRVDLMTNVKELRSKVIRVISNSIHTFNKLTINILIFVYLEKEKEFSNLII